MKRVLNVVWVAAATVTVAGCTDYDSETDLNPSGPPMIQQVRMKETFTAPGSSSSSERRVFGFGFHPMATDAEQPCKSAAAGAACVTSATAAGNSMRLIMDELLRGNSLEEIACRATVDNDAYQRVPVGATPDDIVRCSSPQDVLPRTCTGEFAVCLCELDGGCTVGSETIARGAPVGVLDINQDGAADDTRMTPGAVSIRCGAIDVPVDLDNSYWNPSGNQQVPAMGGFEALGPALVLTPLNGLPTNIGCALEFAADVTDKQDERICAPAGGDMNAGCVAGDVSAFKFTVEPMVFLSEPANMAMGVSRTDPAIFLGNTNVDVASLAGITVQNVTAGTTLVAGTDYTVALMMNKNVTITWVAQLAAASMYTVTLPTTVTDTFGQGLPQPTVVTFTTAN